MIFDDCFKVKSLLMKIKKFVKERRSKNIICTKNDMHQKRHDYFRIKSLLGKK